jgi:CRP-like cAMP-binding protein
MAKTVDPRVPYGLPIRRWLAECSPQFREELLALGRPKSFPAGSVLYRAGDRGQDMYAIVSGVVLVQSRFTHPDAVLLHMLRPGEWFGTLDWLHERGRRFTTIARTDVDLLRISNDQLQALLQSRPEGFVKIAGHAAYGLDLAMQCAADLLIKRAPARCAAGLLRLSGRRWASDPEADLPSDIPASQAELAMLCNVSRKTFSRVILELSQAGLVTLGYRSLTVNHPARLRVIADTG